MPPQPGRATLTSGLDDEEDRRPLFEDGARWESIDAEADHEEEEGDGPHELQQLAQLQAAPETDGDESVAAAGPSEAGETAAPESADDAEQAAAASASEFVDLEPAAAEEGVDADDADDADGDAPAIAARSLRSEPSDADPDGPDDDAAAPATPASQNADADSDADRDGGAPLARAAAATGPSALPPIKEPKRERKKKSKGYFADTDKFNKKITRRKGGKKGLSIDRAGVRVRGRDSFSLTKSSVDRFLIDDGNTAKKKDSVTKKYLKNGGRLAINPTRPRELETPGGKELCVLTWSGGKGAAFMPVKYIGGAKKSQILAAVRRDNSRRAPGHASEGQLQNAMRYVFIDAAPATRTKADEKRYVVPNQRAKGANRVDHYLVKDRGPNRGEVNVLMNLPQPKVAPVAIDVVDVAKPGQFFFVPYGKKFYREIAIYRRNKSTSELRQTWVFGYLSKGGSSPVIDKARRGWVSLRVVKKG